MQSALLGLLGGKRRIGLGEVHEERQRQQQQRTVRSGGYGEKTARRRTSSVVRRVNKDRGSIAQQQTPYLRAFLCMKTKQLWSDSSFSPFKPAQVSKFDAFHLLVSVKLFREFLSHMMEINKIKNMLSNRTHFCIAWCSIFSRLVKLMVS